MIATIMTQISSAMPTAVITESSEKMMSRIAIWMMTFQKPGDGPAACQLVLAFDLVVNLDDAAADQKQAADEENQVAGRDLVDVLVVLKPVVEQPQSS